jgi:dipeptidyl-peptidase-4
VRVAILAVVAAGLVAAARKPVTIEAAAAPKPSEGSTPVWSRDGARFAWEADRKVWVFEVAGATRREVVGLAALKEAAVDVPAPERFGWVNRGVKEKPIQWFPDGQKLLVAADGDLFVVGSDGKWEQITKTGQAEADPQLSPDGRWVSFRRDHELHVMEVRSRKVSRLTHDATPTRWNAELDWVYPEELAIPTAHWWSPDSTRIAYLQFDVADIMVYPHADLLKLRPVAEPQRFPQAGTRNARARLGVVAATGGKTK